MATIEIMKCDGCEEEVRGGELIAFTLAQLGWLQLKVTGKVVHGRGGSTESFCDDALFHFCPRCNGDLYHILREALTKQGG